MLSRSLREEFFGLGYAVVPAVVPPGEIACIASAFDRLEEIGRALDRATTVGGSLFVIGRADATRAPRIDRVVWCGAAEPVLLRAGRSPRILELAAELLGSDSFDHIINQAHIKSPGDGLSFGWHQDSAHRRYGTDLWRDVNGRGSFVQVIVAVDPMTRENGALAVVPNTPRLGHVPVDPNGSLPADALTERDAVLIEADPGTAVLLHPFAVHASGPNLSRSKRRAFINGFASPGANHRVYPGAGTGVRLSIERSTAA